MNTTLLLLRHGETEWNRLERYQGQSDPPLSGRGEAQARCVAQHLGGLKGIISSPLQRAYSTARIVADQLGLAVATDARLSELAYGEWEGLRQAEVKVRWPELLRQWKQSPDLVSFPGGESLAELRKRVGSFLSHAATQSGPLLVVSHAGVIKVAVLEALGTPLSAFRQVQIPNASITTLRWQEGRFYLVGYGKPLPSESG